MLKFLYKDMVFHRTNQERFAYYRNDYKLKTQAVETSSLTTTRKILRAGRRKIKSSSPTEELMGLKLNVSDTIKGVYNNGVKISTAVQSRSEEVTSPAGCKRQQKTDADYVEIPSPAKKSRLELVKLFGREVTEKELDDEVFKLVRLCRYESDLTNPTFFNELKI